MCDANGMTEDLLARRGPDAVQHVEMFMFNYPRLDGLRLFVNLTSLSVMQQNLTAIEGLDQCVHLRQLWVVECKVRAIEGLDALIHLERLYLYSNQLRAIANLERLANLHTLWLCDNQISVVEGLASCSALRELNLARNRLERFAEALLPNRALESVNVADNRVGSFKELTTFGRAPRLRELNLRDPHWGSNPIVGLSNYQTFALFSIPCLAVLDTVPVADETKALAEATYMKKKLYYSARAKTLRRDVAGAAKLAEAGRDAMLAEVETALTETRRREKAIERCLDADEDVVGGAEQPAASTSAPSPSSRREWRRRLAAAASALTLESAAIARAFEACASAVHALANARARELAVELETGGNVRFEDGRAAEDAWRASCADLVRGRFFANDYRGRLDAALPGGRPTGVRVLRVARARNRRLRDAFDRAVRAASSSTAASSPGSGPPSRDAARLEYLFLGEDPEAPPGELRRCLEDGFRSPAEYAALGRDEAVVLTDSLSLADNRRLERAAEEAEEAATEGSFLGAKKARGRRAPRWTRGTVLVAKAYLGKTSGVEGDAFASFTRERLRPEKEKPVGDVREAPAGEASNVSRAAPSRVRAGAYAGLDAVSRRRASDAKQTAWYALNKNLALPEYLVEFEYETARAPSERGEHPRFAELIHGTAAGGARGKAEVEKLPRDVWTIAAPLAPFLAAAAAARETRETKKEGEGEEEEGEGVGVDATEGDAGGGPTPRRSAARGVPRSSASGVGSALDLVARAPQPPPPATFVASVSDALARVATGVDLASLTRLNLHASGIAKISGLDACPNLVFLGLSFNAVTKVEGLDPLARLERLDLGFNALKRIEGLAGLGRLRALEMNDNALFRLEDLNALKRCVPDLTSLNLRGNAVSDNGTYRGLVLRRLLALESLDGVPVTERDREAAAESSSALNAATIREGATFKRAENEARASRESAGAGGTARAADEACAKEEEEEEDAWWARVDELSLERRDVRRLTNLERLVNLRVARFSQNEISRLEGLDKCVALEELNLESNRITALDGAQTLVALRALNLAKNRVRRVENLAPHLANLTQLSLEDNLLTTLRGISGLDALMELYVGNNQIAELREVLHLKPLPKLIVLDALGNPMCDAGEGSDAGAYREYVVYHLRRVKVLDGVGVEAAELSRAKGKYSGLITREFLEEKLRRRFFNNVRELDLSHQRVRELGTEFAASGSEFDAVRALDLRGNSIARPEALCALPKLAVLRLDGNRIEANAMWSVAALRAHAEARDAERRRRGDASGASHHPRVLRGEAPEKSDPSASADDERRFLARHPPFPALEELHLGACGITLASNLKLVHATLPSASFGALRALYLQDNDIQRLDAAALSGGGLARLETLVLDRNRIKRVDDDAFEGLVNLKVLRMEENGLKTLAHLAPLAKLRELHLACNRVADIAELERLAALGELRVANLAANPACRKQVYRPIVLRHCPALRTLDGKAVTEEERDHVEYLFSPVDQAAEAQHAAHAANAALGRVGFGPQLLNNGARLGGGTAQAGTPAFLPTGAGAVERSAALGDLKTGAAAATIGSLLAGAGGKTSRETNAPAGAARGAGPRRTAATGMTVGTASIRAAEDAPVKGGGEPSLQRLAALQADLKRQAVQSVARRRAEARAREAAAGGRADGNGGGLARVRPGAMSRPGDRFGGTGRRA